MSRCNPPPIIEAKHIGASYGNTPILHDVSFHVKRGESLAIIGPSGGGKSTLLACLCLLEPISSGELWIDGVKIDGSRSQINLVREKVGIVFQQFDLFPHLTVLANLTLAPRHVRKCKKGDAESKAHRLLERLELDSKSAAFPHELSGGQQQRIAIARALMMDPEVLLLDEVTSSLDPEMAEEVTQMITGMVRTVSVTTIVVTHDMTFASQVAGDVIQMVKGHIVRRGTPADVIGQNIRSRATA